MGLSRTGMRIGSSANFTEDSLTSAFPATPRLSLPLKIQDSVHGEIGM